MAATFTNTSHDAQSDDASMRSNNRRTNNRQPSSRQPNGRGAQLSYRDGRSSTAQGSRQRVNSATSLYEEFGVQSGVSTAQDGVALFGDGSGDQVVGETWQRSSNHPVYRGRQAEGHGIDVLRLDANTGGPSESRRGELRLIADNPNPQRHGVDSIRMPGVRRLRSVDGGNRSGIASSSSDSMVGAEYRATMPSSSIAADQPVYRAALQATAQSRTAQSRTAQSRTAQSRTAQSRTAQSRTAQSRTAQLRREADRQRPAASIVALADKETRLWIRRTVVASLLILVAYFGAALVARHVGISAVPPPYHGNTSSYVVMPGDTLWAIAARVDPSADRMSVVEQLVAINGDSEISAGDTILIPAST